MSFRKILRGLPEDILSAKGILEMDWAALTPCQRECTARLGMTMQLEQEAYLTQHPEIKAALEVFMSKMVSRNRLRGVMKTTAEHFTRPLQDLEDEVRKRLGVPKDAPFVNDDNMSPFHYKDKCLIEDLRKIILKHYPPEPMKWPTPPLETPNTLSSSFISIITSDTTLPTPEPVKEPEPTLSDVMYALVSNTLDKAIYSRFDDSAMRYDTAYVELMRAVEDAMEVPVKEIRVDIAELFVTAYRMFELNIIEKERIAAEEAWEKRMRKKMKRTLRRQKNFKGYETPPTPKSVASSHESYKKPPHRPCPCNPKTRYNRYAKDRFGIYLPRDEEFSKENVTATPALPGEEADGEEHGAASVRTTGSATSQKSSQK